MTELAGCVAMPGQEIDSTMSKRLWLFALTSLVAGIAAIGGSILGAALGKTGLFAGAIIGGIFGVAAAAWIAVRSKLIGQASYFGAVLGGIIGFAAAALIATSNLHTPVIPILSVTLIGLGAVLGSTTGKKT